MLKCLIQKQLSEIFRSYLYDAKKNKARPKGAVIAYFVLFALLIVFVLGGLFTFMAFSVCKPLCDADMPWLYFLIMGLLSVFLGTFGSVFNTYSGLYLAKDNDLLLSMPIPVRYILLSRLASVYLLGFLYSAVVIVPTCIVYWVVYRADAAAVFGGILLTLLVSLLVFTLSCMLGWVVAQISKKLKNKSVVTVLVSLVFIGAYYFFYFKAKDFLFVLIQNAALYGNIVHTKAYPLYLFGRVGTGDWFASAVVTLSVIAVLSLVLYLLSHSFIRIATASDKTEKRAYKSSSVRKSSLSRALLNREKRHFVSNPTYMLNCGLGILFLPLCGIVMLWKGNTFIPILTEIFEDCPDCIVIIASVVLCVICAVNAITEPSVSLEGNTLGLIRSLPVTTKQILGAKIRLHAVLTAIPCLFCIGCFCIVYPIKPLHALLLLLQTLSFILLSAQVGLYLGLKMPIMNWTSDITPIKQSAGILLDLLFCWLYSALPGILFFLTDCSKIGVTLFMAIACAVNVALCALLHCRINTKGCRLFEAL